MPSARERAADSPPSTGRQAAWNYLVFGLSKSSTLIMTVVVARLLVPADFGLFALALLVVNLFDYMKDLGVGAALVQHPGNWNRLAPTGLTLSVIFGVVFGIALAAAAPLGAELLDQPQLTPLIRVLAIGLAISALGVIPAARLRRDLDFRKRIWPEFLGAAVKAALTIGLATQGVGVWSLVYGQLAGTVVTTVLYWRVARTPVEFGFDRREARGLVRFGVALTAAALLGFAISNVDYLFIGIRLGDEQLGYYTLAYRLPELLVLNLCIVISEVLFSSLSRLQHSRQLLADQYLKVTTAAVALSAPIGVTLAAAAPAVIGTMYGDQYADAAPVLAILSIYTLVYSASWHAGDVFKAMGRASLMIATTVGHLGLMIAPIWFAAGHSIVMVALVLLAVETVPFVANMLIVRSVAGISAMSLANAVFRPLPAAAVMAVVMLGLGRLVGGLPDPVILLLTFSAGLLAYIAALRLTAPELFAAGLAAVRSARGRGADPSTAAEDPVEEPALQRDSERNAERGTFEGRVSPRPNRAFGVESSAGAAMKGQDEMSDPTRVLMILDSFNFGGAENLIAELGRYHPAALDVSVASLASADQDRNAMLDRLTEADLQPEYLSVDKLLDPAGFLRLVRTLRRARVDVVHAHLGYAATLVPLAARLAGKPVVATLHLSPQRHSSRREWLKERLSVRIPARLGRLVLVSQHAFDQYALVHGPARASWRMIPNGVDVQRYTVRSGARASEAPVWAVVAALRPDKNHVDLIRAWIDVVAAHPGAILLVIGDGPSRGDIEQAVTAAGLGESVEFLGRREDVAEILRRVDGVVSASVDEALPTALIEAGASGLPVVATDAGGTREIVVDGITGRLVPIRDVPALAAALLDTIGDPARAAAYGAAGRAQAQEKYSMSKWVDRLDLLYKEAISGAPAASLTVAHVIHSLGPGGAEGLLVELARAAPVSGVRLIVIGLSDEHCDSGVDNRAVPPLRALGATVYEMHTGRYDITAVWRLAGLLRDEHVDIVHTHLKHADVVGGIAARLAGVPSVSTLHVIDIPTSRMHRARVKIGLFARRHLSSTVIALSTAQRRWYVQYSGDDASIMVLPNGIGDPGVDGDSSAIRAELRVPDGALLASCVSLMRPEKGHADLLEAVRRLPDDLPLVLALAGDGPLLESFRSTVDSDSALRDRVRVLGFRSDAADLIAASDFVVHPSLEDALPTALISALAGARPIVATDVGGIPDIVTPDCGLLVEAGRPSELSAGIAKMASIAIDDPAVFAEMRQAARVRYESHFSSDIWVKNLRAVYERAINARREQGRLHRRDSEGDLAAQGAAVRPRRIALVEFAPSGGLFQFSLQLGEALARAGVDVELITGPSPELTSREPGCRVRTVLPTWHPAAGADAPRWWRRARRGIRAGQYSLAWAVLLVHLFRTRPDAIIWSAWRFPIDGWGVHVARKALPNAVLAAVAHEPRPVVEQPGQDSLYKTSSTTDRALSTAYADLDVAFVLGEKAKQILTETWPITAPVHVIPHGDEGIFANAPIPGAEATGPVALSFGLITAYKGIDTLCEAWPMVRAEIPDAELVIAGALSQDIDELSLRQQVSDLAGVSLRIGYVPVADVSSLFARARCVVLPYKRSSQSGVAHLAHTLRRPVVATRVGDIPAVVRDGESGLLVAPEDPEALAAAVVRLLEDPQLARTMGETGGQDLRSASSWDDVASGLYQGLVGKVVHARNGKR